MPPTRVHAIGVNGRRAGERELGVPKKTAVLVVITDPRVGFEQSKRIAFLSCQRCDIPTMRGAGETTLRQSVA
jgi:hypothetical protein